MTQSLRLNNGRITKFEDFDYELKKGFKAYLVTYEIANNSNNFYFITSLENKSQQNDSIIIDANPFDGDKKIDPNSIFDGRFLVYIKNSVSGHERIDFMKSIKINCKYNYTWDTSKDPSFGFVIPFALSIEYE